MTHQEINVEIALTCGYQWVSNGSGYRWLTRDSKYINNPKRKSSGTEPPCQEFLTVDYYNDLNAMHEAEKVLTSRQRAVYEVLLTESADVVSVPHAAISTGGLFEIAHRTASQRAEAFVRTVNKWKSE
jgi:hypothetical protein